jgi:Fe2+ or Zn2+ uptake regulation protein
MGIIVCQSCNKIIEFFDDEKSSILFGKCPEECEYEGEEQE